jgi:hypothetical protein
MPYPDAIGNIQTENAISVLCTGPKKHLVVLNGILGQQIILLPFDTRLHWWLNKIVEQKGSINQQRKSKNLKPLECLPTQAQRDNPDKEGTARVDRGTRGRGDGSSHGETEEVEAAVKC